MKKCSLCKKNKKIELFYKNKAQKDGLSNYCKLCLRNLGGGKYKYVKAAGAKRFYLKHKDTIIKNQNVYNKEKDGGLLMKYLSIDRRCNYPSQQNYKWYGGRGVKLLWNSYQDFKKDMGKSYAAHIKKYGKLDTTIDRIKPDGHYCKKNCRWRTRKQQLNTTRFNYRAKTGKPVHQKKIK